MNLRKQTISAISIITSLAFFATLIPTSVFALGTIERVSLAFDGSEANGYSFNSADAVSADGRYVVFTSSADNLVASDINSGDVDPENDDVFVYDTQTGDVELISVNSSEVQDTTGYSSFASISGDGRYVVFRSSADGLVSPATTPGVFHIYLRDRTLGKTTLVSVDASGNEGDDNSLVPTISTDGSTIAFISSSQNLVAGDNNASYDIYLRERDDASTIERVTVDALGGDSGGNSYIPSLSEDGRYVVFMSLAGDLDVDCSTSSAQVYVRDMLTDTTNCVSMVGSTSTYSNGSVGNDSSISDDGRYVVFSTDATNLDVACTSGDSNVYLRDTVDQTTTCISVTSDGIEGDDPSSIGVISGDAEYVVFLSSATNLVTDDTNGRDDVFIYQISTGELIRASVNADSDQSNHDSGAINSFLAISQDGEYVVFASEASNFVPNSGDTNALVDIFMKSIDFSQPTTTQTHSTRGSSALRRLLAKNRNTQTTMNALCSTSNLLKMGSVGSAVSDLQKEFDILVDGIFGNQTKTATMNYQSNNNLVVDGVVGSQTRSALCK